MACSIPQNLDWVFRHGLRRLLQVLPAAGYHIIIETVASRSSLPGVYRTKAIVSSISTGRRAGQPGCINTISSIYCYTYIYATGLSMANITNQIHRQNKCKKYSKKKKKNTDNISYILPQFKYIIVYKLCIIGLKKVFLAFIIKIQSNNECNMECIISLELCVH